MGRFLIETHLRTGRPIKELAAAHEVSARWLFKLLRRYRLEGPAGLEPRSRRPHRSPTRIADVYEDEIVALHKRLADDGLDAGAATIHFHLAQRYSRPPSVSTIFRVLKARGFVTLSPQKRPKSSFKRFVADLPNECWQADMTHVEFGGGGFYEVLNMIDDHSRLCVALESHEGGQGQRRRPGPAQSGRDQGISGFVPQRQRAHLHHPAPPPRGRGDRTRALRPRHRGQARPALPPPDVRKGRAVPPDHEEVLGHAGHQSPKQLQRQLDRFVEYYNEERPHRGIGRKTPAAVYSAREKAVPSPSFVKVGDRRLRFDRVDKAGRITLRHRGRLHHIGIGNAYAGWRVAMLIDGLDIEIVGFDGSPLRRLVLDPTKDYQRIP